MSFKCGLQGERRVQRHWRFAGETQSIEGSALGMLAAPTDEVAGAVEDGVTRGIDHKTERADFIFGGGNEIASLHSRTAVPAKLGHAFHEARLMARSDRGDHDPVGRVFALEGPLVLDPALAGFENHAMNCLVGVRLGVAQRFVG